MMLFRLGLALYWATSFGQARPQLQYPLGVESTHVREAGKEAPASRPLHGKFLHITDIHPDPFYKTYSSTSAEKACHHGSGSAGVYGAELTDCDTPYSLVNETFRWIDENLKDSIDFVIWTGDSARHDNDEAYPRTDKQVLTQNTHMVEKFVEVFGKDENINDTDPTNDFIIPIIPTFGNNDILPHNIFTAGPNRWTRKYLNIWKKFIPEEQRHTFAFGGWFFTEVVPNRLAVFSLNTLYFFDSNSAVDGCAEKSEPGYQHMEWLRIQLQFLRQRGMKAIMMGHVPPARTEGKQSWDETCWQKYTLWMRQYRDVVVGGVFGHMNIDHFLFQDEHDVKLNKKADVEEEDDEREALGDRMTIAASSDYLVDLRKLWSKIPSPPSGQSYHTVDNIDSSDEDDVDIEKRTKKKKSKKEKRKRFLQKIGGKYAERYSVTLVSPSVIPNYFPSLRVIEYNITGLNNTLDSTQLSPAEYEDQTVNDRVDGESSLSVAGLNTGLDEIEAAKKSAHDDGKGKKAKKGKKGKKGKKKKPKKPSFPTPKPPSSTSPPGPAYSPQTFTWTGIVQYYANLTYINNDFAQESVFQDYELGGSFNSSSRWREGPHGHKKTPKKPHPRTVEYEIEYETKNDTILGSMPDLTVRSWLDRAEKIGRFDPRKADGQIVRAEKVSEIEEDEAVAELEFDIADGESRESDGASTAKKKKKGKKNKKNKKRKAANKAWFTFVRRAYVGSMSEEQVHEDFGLLSSAAKQDDRG